MVVSDVWFIKYAFSEHTEEDEICFSWVFYLFNGITLNVRLYGISVYVYGSKYV